MDNFKGVQKNAFYYQLTKNLAIATILLPFILFFVAILESAINSWPIFILSSLVIIAVFGLFVTIKCFLEYKNLGFKVEDNSLSFRNGLLSMHTTTIAYSKITNVSYNQGLLARLFSVGDIKIDQDDSVFIYTGVDKVVADEVLDTIAKKSNIQPISGAMKS